MLNGSVVKLQDIDHMFQNTERGHGIEFGIVPGFPMHQTVEFRAQAEFVR